MGSFTHRPGFVELDGPRLYAAVLSVKQILDLTWDEVVAASGVSYGPLKKLKADRSVEATTFLRLVVWLGQTRVEFFTRTVEERV